ncbi:hypothetical protein [Massilia antarctica]|uniref:hypothetical protein n=1 Tax=Massilia antarctica TaxID=2765360 RepID=UPI0006BB8933|nr:hypothetical protein [Massilia sp. H27-R4]MCY0915650.1 hypothetical protein [Massilia sp. H27-R4]MCY0915652.1 hypothetical protein [Massilia sp. H27-R4]
MRINTIITHLRPDDAHTLIEFLDQLRTVLMQTYGCEIEAMLQECCTQHTENADDDDVPF